jgi:hypothetical protein
MSRLGLHRQRIALKGDAARLVEDLAAKQGLTVPEVVRQALLRERQYWEEARITAEIPEQMTKGDQYVQN